MSGKQKKKNKNKLKQKQKKDKVFHAPVILNASVRNKLYSRAVTNLRQSLKSFYRVQEEKKIHFEIDTV